MQSHLVCISPKLTLTNDEGFLQGTGNEPQSKGKGLTYGSGLAKLERAQLEPKLTNGYPGY